jgi:ABC-type Fe3+/spermidine/putrescine transport system ATPase subunit
VNAFLSLRGVRKTWGDHVAVADVDLDIGRGEFVTLLGPSGCGKTTLLRMIAGFEQPSAGTITLAGSDLTRLPPERRPLNMVFQSYALFPHMSVYDNVAYGLRMHGRARDDVDERVGRALGLVGLTSFRDRPVQELSGGMSQRVALVRALVNEPDVLLLDEPLGALDLQLRKRMQVELRAIQDRLGTTFVYVTHDQEEALALSRRVVVMRDGHVEQAGTPEEVYHRPATRFVAEFVGETSLLPATVTGLSGGGLATVALTEAGHLVDVTCPDGLAVGDRGVVSLRPEDLVVAAAASLRGVAEDTLFVGSAIHVLLRLATGEQLRLAMPSTTPPPARGEEVAVAVLPHRGRFLPE